MMTNESQMMRGRLGLWVLFFIYVATCIWLVSISVRGVVHTPESYWTGLPFFILPFVGGCMILHATRGQRHSFLGKAFASIAAGLILWGFGSAVYLYYNVVLLVPLPYPSLGEIGYGGAFAFWILGLIFLNLGLDFGFRLKTVVQKVIFFLLPFVVISLSYYLFFALAQGGFHVSFVEAPLKAFFDIAYPACDTLILFLLSIPLYGLYSQPVDAKYKKPLLLLCGAFLVEYGADFVFSYRTFRGTYGIGSWSDLLFITAIFLMLLSLHLFVREFSDNSR